MPPVLDPAKSKVDGLAFLGLSLTQHSQLGHPDSDTHQTAFDLNDVIDRDYQYLFSTNDDGWLVGGGEPGPPTTYKLAAKDSAHVEIMRIGTYRKEWGGVPLEEILAVMTSGEILIPQIDVVPTGVVANPDTPPELEIRFDMVDPEIITNFDDLDAPLPVNWQLRFLHNQFFKKFIFPSRFCPGAFHSTILRKAEFRSDEYRAQYFAKCDAAVQAWRQRGPQPLNTIPRALDGQPLPVVVDNDDDDEERMTTQVTDVPKNTTTDKEIVVEEWLVSEEATSPALTATAEETSIAVRERVAALEALTAMALETSVVSIECSPVVDETMTPVVVPVKDGGPVSDDEADEKKEDDKATPSSTQTPLTASTTISSSPVLNDDLIALDSVMPTIDKRSEASIDLEPPSQAFEAKATTNLEVSLECEGDDQEPESDKAGPDEEKLEETPEAIEAKAITNLEVSLESQGDDQAQECNQDCPDDKKLEENVEEAPEAFEAKAVTNLEVSLESQGDNQALEDDKECPDEERLVKKEGENEPKEDTDKELKEDPREDPMDATETSLSPSTMASATTNLEVQLEESDADVEETTDPVGESKLDSTPVEDNNPSAIDSLTHGGYHSGIWLFVDRQNITHFFSPNFLPPYDTPEKKRIILDILREEWDEKTLSWKPCGEGSMTKKKASSTSDGSSVQEMAPLQQFDNFMGGILDAICSSPATIKQPTATK